MNLNVKFDLQKLSEGKKLSVFFAWSSFGEKEEENVKLTGFKKSKMLIIKWFHFF